MSERLPARETLAVTTVDGWKLELEHAPALRPRATLLCGPAMMVDRRTLDTPRGAGLGSYFQARGFDVYMLDPRGHGGSGPWASREVNWTYDDIVHRDLPAAIRALKQRHPDQKLAVLGHSLCGHATAAGLGLWPELPVDALVMITANIWLPSLEPSRPHWWTKRALVSTWVRMTRLRGFFPTRALRLGSNNEARGYVKQFETWASTGRWVDETGHVDYLEALERVRVPTLALSARGDHLLCRSACARRFVWRMRRAAVTFVELGASELGTNAEPGHMSLVLDPACAAAWQHIEDWLRETLKL